MSSDSSPDVLLDLSSKGTTGGRERDCDGDEPIRADVGTLGHSQLDDVAPQFWVNDTSQETNHFFFGEDVGLGHAMNSNEKDRVIYVV